MVAERLIIVLIFRPGKKCKQTFAFLLGDTPIKPRPYFKCTFILAEVMTAETLIFTL